MRRWGLLVAFLYVLVLVALTIPILVLAFSTDAKGKALPLDEAANIYAAWPYWVWLGVMGLCQLALLKVPVALSAGRPVSRRALAWPVAAAGLMMGLLFVGASWSLMEFFWHDKGSDEAALVTLGLGSALWIAWGVVFYRRGRDREPGEVVRGQSRLLLAGSILDLLVAVPTHIVARSREYCCAGFLTFVGIALGISVMLFAFGPAVFFLYAARWRRLHPGR